MADENLRKFIEALGAGVASGSFVKLTLAKYRGAEADLKNVYVRPVNVKGGARLSFLRRYRTKDLTSNLAPEEGVRAVEEMLGKEFFGGHLFTLERDLQIEFNRKGESRLVERPATHAAPPAAEHDRRKRRHVQVEGNVYLRELGVTNERGEVRPAMGDKLRQINKFVEIVGGLVASSALGGREEVAVVDVGSGKGYLTFGVYDYLNHALGLRASVTGVEARPELVELCNEVARRAGFDRLAFRAGLVEELRLPATDVLIALHACDTATDEAIHKGVAAGASIIITAPCCHKEVRPQIEAPAVLRPLLRHGILLEREAEAVTDSMRALLLESAGYRVKVFEFVSTEHTRKNTLVTGVRAEGVDAASALRQFRELKEFYGIREQRLEKLLCETG